MSNLTPRRSIMDRYAQRNAEAALSTLEARADALANIGPAISPLHRQTVDVLTRLMLIGRQMTDKDTPQHFRMLMTMLEHSRDLMLEGIAKVPAPQIREFMTQLRDEIQSVIDAPDEDVAGYDERTPAALEAGAPALEDLPSGH
jgi:hypothetical protein